MIIGNKRKDKNSSALPGQMVSRNTKVFNGDAEFLEVGFITYLHLHTCGI